MRPETPVELLDGGEQVVADPVGGQRDARPVLALQKLGTRAVVAEVLIAKAEKVAKPIEHLLDAGAEGDLNAAKALVPWIDQAFGKPTERVEYRTPTGLEDLEFMSEVELARLVARGRADRSRREREAREDDGDDDVVID